MDLDDFEVTDYSSDINEYDLLMDEEEVGVAILSESPQQKGALWFELPTAYAAVLLGVVATGCVVLLCVSWLLRPRKLTKPSKEKRGVDSEIASRIRSVPIEEVEKVLYAGCLYIQDGCGSEVELLYAAQSRLMKELSAYEGTRDDEIEDDECRDGVVKIRKQRMQNLHSLLESIEGYVGAILNMLPQEKSVFNLQHKEEQIFLMNSISRLNSLLQPVKHRIETHLFSTLPSPHYRVTEYAFDLRRSVKKARDAEGLLKERIEGKQVLRADSDIEIIRFSEEEISATKIELELALRTLVEDSAYLSTYDKTGKYETLLGEARNLSTSMYALQDDLEKQALEVRLEREKRSVQETMITGAEQTFLALNGSSQSSGSILDGPSSAEEAGSMKASNSATVQGGVDSQSMSLIYSNYMLASQGRRKDLEEGAIKRQEDRGQRRLDVTVTASQAAKAQYHTDSEAEVNKKIKLAGLSLQRSNSKEVADKAWAETCKKELELAYGESLSLRRRQDLWLFSGVLLIMTVSFCITAFKCDVAGGLRQALEQATWQFCSLLSQQQSCDAREESMGKASSSDPGLGVSASSLLHQVSSRFYGTLSSALRVGGSRVLLLSGLDVGSWALPETVTCFTQATLRMVTPYLIFKFAQTAGVRGTHAMAILFTGAYLSFAEVVHSLVASALSGPYAVLLIVHFSFVGTAYHLDLSLHWSALGASLWQLKRPSADPTNYRTLALCTLYPAVMVTLAMLLGCFSSSRSYSRGVQLGRRVGLSELLTCIPGSLQQCIEKNL